MKLSTKILSTTMGAVLSIGFVGQAHAWAYAYAYDDVFDFSINVTNGSLGSPGYTSQTEAEKNANSDGISDQGITGPRKAWTHCTDTGCTKDSFATNPPRQDLLSGDPTGSQQGKTGNYGSGIAEINSPASEGMNLAEAYTNGGSPANPDVASGLGSNALRQTFTAGTDAAIAFSFSAIPYLEAEILPPTGPLPQRNAKASLGFSITITDSIGNIVFNWQPNGLVTAIPGGTETLDDLSLNVELSVCCATPGPKYHNPTEAIQNYAASTNAGIFTSGEIYTIDVTMIERADVSDAAIPVPATLLLLPLGLAGLGYSRRRKVELG